MIHTPSFLHALKQWEDYVELIDHHPFTNENIDAHSKIRFENEVSKYITMVLDLTAVIITTTATRQMPKAGYGRDSGGIMAEDLGKKLLERLDVLDRACVALVERGGR